MPSRKTLWTALLLVLVVATFFRVWQITDLPPGLFGDEAADGLDALDVLAGRGRIFFPANYGREGLHMWLVAGAFRLGGITPLALRLPSVLAGILTAGVTVWLGTELFGLRRRADSGALWLATVAGFYLATSYWHVHFSRFGIRGVFTPLMLALTAAAFWRAINLDESGWGRRWSWFGVAGLSMGLGVHFYTASRFAPIFFGFFLFLEGILTVVQGRWKEALLRRHFGGLLFFYAVSALLFAPLGYYFWTHPGSFGQRAGEVFAFREGFDWTGLGLIGRAGLANLAQFVLPGGGDQARFYNLPGRAVFDPLSAILGLWGLLLLLWRWRRPANLFLLLWLGVMVIPAFLAVDRYPTLPRVLGVIPGIYFFPAVGLMAGIRGITRIAQKFLRPNQEIRDPARFQDGIALLCILAALTLHAGLTYRDYFLDWGPDPATQEAFEVDMTEAWQWLRANPQSGPLYLAADLYRHPTFMLLHEQVPTSQYFQHQNPDLHWFDPVRAWPLGAPGSQTTHLLAGPASPPNYMTEFLQLSLTDVGDGQFPGWLTLATGGSAAGMLLSGQGLGGAESIPVGDHLQLLGQTGLALTGQGESGQQVVTLQLWESSAPQPDRLAGYQVQSEVANQSGALKVQVSAPMGYRPPEWGVGERFVTWQLLTWRGQAGDEPAQVALRIVDLATGAPLTVAGSAEGWIALAYNKSQ